MSSMGALAAASASTFLMLGLGSGQMLVLGFALTFLIFWRHRENIARIRAGTEPKVGRKG
jgi:glycerol-3-phosphate acyltransferase PlsY